MSSPLRVSLAPMLLTAALVAACASNPPAESDPIDVAVSERDTAGAVVADTLQPPDSAPPLTVELVEDDSARTDSTSAAAIATVSATLDEWRVVLPSDTVAAGRTAFRVTNTGAVDHRFEVEGGGNEWETDLIPAGGSATLTVDLPPGTYEVYCPVVGPQGEHEALGMRTTLVVR